MLYILIFSMIIFVFFGIFITKKVINPLSAFNLIWLFVISLYQLRMSYLQVELQTETIETFLVCIFSFSMMFILLYMVKFRKVNNIEKDEIIEYNTIKKMFILWILVEIIETIVSGGLPIIWKIIGSSKTYMNYGIPTLHGLMNAVGLVIILLSFYLYMYKKNEYNIKDKRLIKILTAVCLYSLCLITRQVIITAVIEMVIIYLYFQKRIPWKKIITISLVGMILFGIIGNFRTGYDEFLYVAVMRNTNIPKSLIGIYWVYMYLTMTVSNVNNAVIEGINGYGVTPIASIYIPTVISKILFSNLNAKIPSYLVTKAFNVSGFFIEFYVGYGNVRGVSYFSYIWNVGSIYNKKS